MLYVMKSKMLKKLFLLLLLLPCHLLSEFYVDDDDADAVVELVLSLVNPYFDCIGYSIDMLQLVQVGPLRSVEMPQPIVQLVYRDLPE
jgi:hypothetical protein